MMRLTKSLSYSLKQYGLTTSRIFSGTNSIKCTCSKNETVLHYGGIRSLYQPASLGIDLYMHRREKWKNKFLTSRETFIDKMTKICEEKQHNIYSDDLRNMLHICEKNKSELNLLHQMIKMYYDGEIQKSSVDFCYATDYMRLFYYFKMPNEASRILNNEELTGFFNQIISYIVAMSLFYESGQYEEVINTMHKVVAKRIFLRSFPKPLLTLTMASCYQMNSPRSLDEALSYIKKGEEANLRIDPKVLSYVSALAIRQNKPLIALELTSKAPWNFYLLKNIKAEALARIGRAEDALPIFRGYSGGYDSISSRNGDDSVIFLQTMNNVETALLNENKSEALSDFRIIKKRIAEQQLISNKSLGEALCEPLSLDSGDDRKHYSFVAEERKKKRDLFAASFERGRVREKNQKNFDRVGFNFEK